MSTSTAVTTATQVSSGVVQTTGGQVDTVTFDTDLDQVEVLAYDGVDWLWFTVNGSAPTVGGKNCYAVPPSVGAGLTVTVPTSGKTVVKLISTAATKYVVSEALA